MAFWRDSRTKPPFGVRSAEFSIIWPDSNMKSTKHDHWVHEDSDWRSMVQLFNWQTQTTSWFFLFWMGNKTSCIACVVSEYLGWLKPDEIRHNNRSTNGRNCMLPWFAPDMHCASKCPIPQLQNMCDMCHVQFIQCLYKTGAKPIDRKGCRFKSAWQTCSPLHSNQKHQALCPPSF